MTDNVNEATPDPSAIEQDSFQLIIPDNLRSASVIFRMPDSELNSVDRELLKREVLLRLRQQRVSFGFDMAELDGELLAGVPYTVARARMPVHGSNAVVNMIEKPEVAPELNDDGTVNYYDINLMHPVVDGEWLGEKHPPTSGIDGIDVSGRILKCTDGIDFPLAYDKESVVEIEEEGVTVLRSQRNGMLHFVGDQVFVLNHKTYEDIDFSTGNVYFDGSVTVKGTVHDGFMVRASGDISILGDMGIGAVSLIESTGGSVFIKGGVAGQFKAVVRAAHDIYTKFVLDASLECGGTINIGFFSRNATLRSEEIIVESSRGRIQGGQAFVGILITANEIGSEMEARTELTIKGFNREELTERMEAVSAEREECRKQIEKTQADISAVGSRRDLDPNLRSRMRSSLRDTMMQSQAKMKIMDNTIRSLQKYLRLTNDGEIRIRRINRNCIFYHNGLGYEIYDRQFGKRYFCVDGALMEKQM